MTVLRLHETDLIDPVLDAHFAVHTTFESLTAAAHCHDFYEIFLLTAGSLLHHVNGACVPLEAGALVFVRPDDVHSFVQLGSADCALINLAFPRRVVDGLLVYLGDGVDGRVLLRPALPPVVQLAAGDLVAVAARLEGLTRLPYARRDAARVVLRVLLADLFTRYFLLAEGAADPALPDWLADLLRQMQEPAHFREGIPAMQRLACKSPAHLSRVCRMYLGQTPTAYVNALRLNYAANLLAHTDRPVIDIALDAGFDNLSYFYRLFHAEYGQPPAQFRRSQRRGVMA